MTGNAAIGAANDNSAAEATATPSVEQFNGSQQIGTLVTIVQNMTDGSTVVPAENLVERAGEVGAQLAVQVAAELPWLAARAQPGQLARIFAENARMIGVEIKRGRTLTIEAKPLPEGAPVVFHETATTMHAVYDPAQITKLDALKAIGNHNDQPARVARALADIHDGQHGQEEGIVEFLDHVAGMVERSGDPDAVFAQVIETLSRAAGECR